MRSRKLLAICVGILVSASGATAWLAGCSVSVQDDAVTFSILGAVFTLTFDGIGPIEVVANQTVSVPTAVRLFDDSPRETPPAGQMSLPSTSVGVARRLTAKTVVRDQSLPLSGSATIRFNIATGQSAARCDSAILLAEFDMTLTSGVAGIVDEVYDLSRQAIAIMITNDVTICIEITADFDGEITIGEYFFAFGGGPGGDEPPSAIEGPAVLPGGLTQIPIDSRSGRAVVAPINRTILGVNYGVVGVLEAQTSAVTNPAGQPSTITVVPAELGLGSVDTIIMGTHSSFVPDVSDGVTLATLSVGYSDGGEATTLDFVTGSTTAEWSYGRPEHTADFGGVQHAIAPVLYSFESTLDSTSEYLGYSYSVSLSVDASRTIASLTLTVADPATYAGARLATGDLAGWASQAITAITLAGDALVSPATQACCFENGSCLDLARTDCVARGGDPSGADTACTSAMCPTTGGNGNDNQNDNASGDPEAEACCFTDGRCTDTDAGSCSAASGTPGGAGSVCNSSSCPGACCETDGSCTQQSVGQCDASSGEYQGFGIACGSDTCFDGCCFNDTLFCFGDISAADCSATGGQPQPSCDGTPCLFPCCQSDGTCTMGLTVDDCASLGGTLNARGTTCDDVICAPATPTKWVLAAILVNPDNNPLVMTYPPGRRDGSITTYTVTETSIGVADSNWDNGFEFWNVTVDSTFPTPPTDLNPGDNVVLSVSFSSGGTVADGNPGAQFQYWVDNRAINPSTSYFYLPWSPSFDGTTSTTYNFTVPSVSSGGQLVIAAFWWNCSSCDVRWVYEPG